MNEIINAEFRGLLNVIMRSHIEIIFHKITRTGWFMNVAISAKPRRVCFDLQEDYYAS